MKIPKTGAKKWKHEKRKRKNEQKRKKNAGKPEVDSRLAGCLELESRNWPTQGQGSRCNWIGYVGYMEVIRTPQDT